MASASTGRGALVGGIVGFIVLHPLVMLAARLMSDTVRHGKQPIIELIGGSLRTSFSWEMLPWGLSFALLSALLGFMYVRQHETLTQKARLQGAMELAGAACHELNQPLQVVMGYAYLLADEVEKHDPLRAQLKTILEEIDKMSLIMRRIQRITHYETQDYIGGVKILDLAKASRTRPPAHSP